MKWQISFEIELPTESAYDVESWAKFELGFVSSLSGKNECRRIDLPAHDELDLDSLRVSRA